MHIGAPQPISGIDGPHNQVASIQGLPWHEAEKMLACFPMPLILLCHNFLEPMTTERFRSIIIHMKKKKIQNFPKNPLP